MEKINKTIFESFEFNVDGINEIKQIKDKGENWPVVYILNGNKEAYVGETNNAYRRMNQHYQNNKRSVMNSILLLLNDSFNKSATLDIENKLIQYMHADGKYLLQNENFGQSCQNNYCNREYYEKCFDEIWDQLFIKKFASKSLFDIKNSEIFKYSPYKQLSSEQFECVDKLLFLTKEAIDNNTSINVTVQGGAGTGKTVLAIYFIKCLVDILNRKTNFENIDEIVDYDSIMMKSIELAKSVKKRKSLNIGFVVPTPAFKDTVKKVFSATKGLKDSMVIGPHDINKKDYDIIIVDEAHRLKRNKYLTNHGAYYKTCDSIGLPHNSTQLDWLMCKKRTLNIIFYDPNQRVKNEDALNEAFNDYVNSSDRIMLTSQLRIKGGNDYINFIRKLLSNETVIYDQKDYNLVIYDDYGLMEKDILFKNEKLNGLCRIVAGICFPYSNKIRDKVFKECDSIDINGDGKYKRSWNPGFNDSSFITDDDKKAQIGCVYTCQGYDLNYAGVILGPDIFYNVDEQKIDIDIDKCTDKKAKVKGDIEQTKRNILNQYLVLLTRGIYGTYIYAVDPNLRKYLHSCIKESKNKA